MTRAAFTVALRGRRLAVRVAPTIDDVDALCRQMEGRARRGRLQTRAFFWPSLAETGSIGTIVLPARGPLAELVPHEAVHAVLSVDGGVHTSSDEPFATAVGRLSACIFRGLARHGIEVRP